MGRWNSVIIPFDKDKKIARKTLIDRKGEAVDLSSGHIQIKSVICSFKKDLKKIGVLVSNIKTHYEIDSKTQVILVKHSNKLFC